MTAYVIEAPPIHENSINYFSAELGFYRLGYVVERYKLSHLREKDISDETPVFGGMESLQLILPHYVGLPYYPTELSNFMYRDIDSRSIGEVKNGEFFKPFEKDHKLFKGCVKSDSFQCELLLSKIPEQTKVWVSSAVTFCSEYRVYVRAGEILNICFYQGDPLIQPDTNAILAMVSKTKGYATAYGLDVGVLENGKTALVELNDFCCLGNYGLKAIEYARCIAERWPELWTQFQN